MLLSLSIRDVVLIEKLDIAFRAGLSVLTGETGAGKSILLDSLGLALGARADSGLVRKGASQLSVTAEFDLPPNHPVRAILDEQGIEAEDMLVVRRTVGTDGRSRAWVNDQAASIGLLRRIGEELVEIHGQFDAHGMMDSATHGPVLDAFGGLNEDVAALRGAFRAWRESRDRREQAEAELARARLEEESLRFALDELETLDPKPGEEEELAERRSVMMHGEKLLEGMNAAFAALTQKGDVEGSLRSAMRALERIADKAEGRLESVIAALDRAAVEAAEATNLLEKASSEIDLDPRHLEQVEERLFALRSCARKHGTDVDSLPLLRDDLARQLRALEGGGEDIARLRREEQAAREAYLEAARALSRARTKAAKDLDKAVNGELKPLKLDKADFRTRVESLDESQWGETGLDRVAFEVSTNPGAPHGPLGKIASGGELSRFMLALKVVLARVGHAGTMVFDEVDSGIGGATAAAVGERLARLATDLQVLVVTHSPQVAALGSHHWRVAKAEVEKGKVVTRIEALSDDERREEVARMLAGAQITDEARAAAASLMVRM
ncbi:DNA repair protein RecN [Telmatospirillum sp. J64-1]|uniref:DNA repair protein RecN n=1 Tax=Telmatospirillum sp. J64-1 TaxID=2502183 RepID=UPI00115F5EE5|nr:DNA repair protein RecN [Telmatospirillum sp. J64-1]